MTEPTLEELDNYNTAAAFAIKRALETGDGKMLRAVKTLMDAVSNIGKAVVEDFEAFKKREGEK